MADDLRAIIGAVLAGRLDLAVIELSLVDGETRLATERLPTHPGRFFCRAGHPLLAERDPTIGRILEFPFAGTRMPPRVAQDFLALAKAGAIDRDTGDYLPPVKVDSIAMVKDIVLESDAVAMAPLAFIGEEAAAGKLVPLAARVAWMQTGYGFVQLRDATLSPAAEAFKEAVRRVENEIAAADDPATAARGAAAGSARRRR
jgi:DNA-binding transcriptional LysR family regulator